MTDSTACHREQLPAPTSGWAATIVPPGTPPAWAGLTWTVRRACGHGTRPALEVYFAGRLMDVLAATPLTQCVLGGGCRTAGLNRELAFAWGRLTATGPPPIAFRARGRPRRGEPTRVTAAGRWFWIAMADGTFTTVTADYPGCRHRLRLRRVRP